MSVWVQLLPVVCVALGAFQKPATCFCGIADFSGCQSAAGQIRRQDVFNCNHERTLALLHFLRTHDNGVTNFHFEVAADLLNDEEIRLIRQMRPGLIQLEIGVQSTNTDTIREIRRNNEA